MESFQLKFLQYVIDHRILCFGDFVLKSGRKSPYFFNAGLFNTGKKLSFLADCYADMVMHSGLEFDVIFGPAYKGIPLASATATALARNHQIDKPYSFNRKEKKAHGEGGNLVGADLKGKALIIDDVITAGTAIREAAKIIKDNGAILGGMLFAMDRQEKSPSGISTIQEIKKDFNVPVLSIITLEEIIKFLVVAKDPDLQKHLKNIEAYQEQYGV
jgi:orotate phosphoribosyltransferase